MRPRRAIILAAGRGSRMGGLTDDRPKGLVELCGRSLIDWQIRALRAAGIRDVVIVTGYCAERFAGLGLPMKYNPDWDQTNMVASLLCADELLDQPVIVSYSDVVFNRSIIEAICCASGELCFAYDASWLEQWSVRFNDPLDDAESLELSAEGEVVDIGRRPESKSEIQGQYTGILRLLPEATGWIREFVDSRGIPRRRDTIDMTSLLRGLVEAGRPVTGVRIEGGWFEVDSERDLHVAEQWIAAGRLNLET